MSASGHPDAEQASLWKAFSEARRSVDQVSDTDAKLPINQGARMFAHNIDQELTVRFLDQGFNIRSTREDSDWQAVFSSSSLPEVSQIVQNGTRVEYVRGPVIEWIDNRADGIQQGFILTQPQGSDGQVRLEIAVGGLSVQSLDPSALRLIDSQGTPRLAYANILAWDSQGTRLPATMEATSDGIALVVATAGASYPITIDPLITTLEQKLLPDVTGDGQGGQRFGHSVSLSGDTAIIGAPWADRTNFMNPGSVYIFVRSSSKWTLQTKLTGNATPRYDQFGTSVSLDGNTALVGVPGNNSTYVYVRSGTKWSLQAKLVPSEISAARFFGEVVSLSGDTALVGDRSFAGGGQNDTGSAYVFERAGTTWTQQAMLTASDGMGLDRFGSSLSLHGDKAIIGAQWDDTDSGKDAGSAYIFVRSGTSWSQQAKLLASDGAPRDAFGVSVALSDDIAVIGAPSNQSTGSTYVFAQSGTSWSLQAKLVPSDGAAGDYFGGSLSFSGDVAIIGASSADTAQGQDAGAAYVFARSGSTWSQQTKLTASDGGNRSYFGSATALSGDTAIIGASWHNNTAGELAGRAYAFTRSGSSWNFQAPLSAGDGGVGDYFGNSVRISGNTALIGAINDKNAAGVGVGGVYVFVRSGTSWGWQAKLTASDGLHADAFGRSVSLSGNTAAIGAPNGEMPTRADAGCVYIFERSGKTWSEQAKLFASDGNTSSAFGLDVSISGDTVLIGSNVTGRLGLYGTTYVSGSAYVFVRSGNSWSQQAKLNDVNGALGDRFGSSVSLFENTALIGSSQNKTKTSTGEGSAFVFTRTGTSWTRQAKLVAEDAAADDRFGTSVSLSGSTALIGAPRDDIGGVSNVGSAYVFVRSGTTWSQQTKLAANDLNEQSGFGNSVSLSGNTALVAAEWNNSLTPGGAYIFARSGESWAQQSKLIAGDFGPYVVSISDDTAIIGAQADSGVSKLGELLRSQGSVYIHRLTRLATADSDGDGVSDVWESVNGFDLSAAHDYRILDTDGDGDGDLLEVFQGTQRASRSERHGLVATSALGDTDAHLLKAIYRRSTTQNVVLGRFEWSTDLITWSVPGRTVNGIRVEISESVIDSKNSYEICEVSATVTDGNPDSLFLRLVLQPAE